jgi:catechol 2,3-dioxygenase-like lactoylglutathione lyase family enzyme
MTRLHIHVSVADLDRSVAFYSRLFGAEPSVSKPDYAKWLLDDPAVNFALSKGAEDALGINHLGLQTDEPAELDALYQRLSEAEIASVPEPGANCCYAVSDKHWTKDPDGVIWEAFRTLDSIPVYGEDRVPV